MTNSIRDYVSIFAELAKKHKEIADFKHLDIEMLIASHSDGSLQTPVLMLDTVKGKIQGQNEDALYQLVVCGFVVLLPVETENYEQQMDVLDRSYGIGMDVLRKIAQEVESLETDVFPWKSVTWEPIGPILDTLFGISFSFELGASFNNYVREDVWETNMEEE